VSAPELLGPTDVRALCALLNLRPNKHLGQNFVVDPGVVAKTVRLAGDAVSHVLEVGPGLGSLTLAMLVAGHRVTAIEIDPVLARQLPLTVAERAPELAERLTVVTADALSLRELPVGAGVGAGAESGVGAGVEAELARPTALVANLPYNVAVPVLLTYLERFDCLTKALVMVQAEVGARLAAPPGSRVYGAPSAKLAWWAEVFLAGTVARNAFFPVPRVDSALVLAVRRPPPVDDVSYSAVSAVIEAAFSQRRKTLRAALAALAGGASQAEKALRAAGIDPALRGECLGVDDFARLARQLGG